MFQKAERKKAKLKIAIMGPSGSGKTYSALLLAKGLGKKIAVIDSENGSASLYADKFDFFSVNLKPPFTTESYLEAIRAAIVGGFDVLIIDSLSHPWAGEGGLLEQKEKLDSRGGRQNSFANWAQITKLHEALKSSLLQSNIHVIATMRSKQDYVLSADSSGKMSPKKVGTAPIQREGMEYEFTTVFDIAMDHSAETSKDRTGLFVDKIFRITEQTGIEFAKWLDSVAPETEDDPLGSFVMSIGQSKGKKLKEIEVPDLIKSRNFMMENFDKQGDRTKENWTVHLNKIEEYLSKLSAEEADKKLPF